jgi:hypothetical protein
MAVRIARLRSDFGGFTGISELLAVRGVAVEKEVVLIVDDREVDELDFGDVYFGQRRILNVSSRTKLTSSARSSSSRNQPPPLTQCRAPTSTSQRFPAKGRSLLSVR